MSSPQYTYPDSWSSWDGWLFTGVLIFFGVAFIALLITVIVYAVRYLGKYKNLKLFIEAYSLVAPREFFRSRNIKGRIIDLIDVYMKSDKGRGEFAQAQLEAITLLNRHQTGM